MLRLEQVTAIFLAAALAIPSYWFFWTLAGGGGYERRQIKELPKTNKINTQKNLAIHSPPLALISHCFVSASSKVER